MALPKSAPEGAPRLRRLFGLNLASDFPFSHRLGDGNGAADLSFTLTSSPVLPSPPWDAAPVYTSPNQTPDGESLCRLYRLGSREVLCFPRIADFDLQEDRISYYFQEPELVELRLLGP